MTDFVKEVNKIVKAYGNQKPVVQLRIPSENILLAKVLRVEGDAAFIKLSGPGGPEILVNLNLVSFVRDVTSSPSHKFVD